jgi:cell division protein FtsX
MLDTLLAAATVERLAAELETDLQEEATIAEAADETEEDRVEIDAAADIVRIAGVFATEVARRATELAKRRGAIDIILNDGARASGRGGEKVGGGVL